LNLVTAKPAQTIESKDDPIDSLLQRLYNGGSATTTSPNPNSNSSNPRGLLQNSSLSWDSSNQSVSEEPVSNVFNESNSYANMRFGYDVEQENHGHLESQTAAQVELGGGSQTEFQSDPFSHAATSFSSVKFDQSVSNQEPLTAEADADTSPPDQILELMSRLKQELAWDTNQSLTETETQAGSSTPDSTDESIGLFDSPVRQSDSNFESKSQSQIQASDSIEDYMSQLFERMQISKEPPPKPAPKSKETPTEVANQATLNESQVNHDCGLMSAEEYVPKQKAKKPESFDTMREIANTTARTAVAFSDLDRRRTRGLMQIAISVGALLMAFYYLLFVCKAAGDTASAIGCLCILISGSFGFLAYRSLRGTKSLTDLLPIRKNENG
jgi:hypothetical protein